MIVCIARSPISAGVRVDIDLTLWLAPTKRAADASATNAMRQGVLDEILTLLVVPEVA